MSKTRKFSGLTFKRVGGRAVPKAKAIRLAKKWRRCHLARISELKDGYSIYVRRRK